MRAVANDPELARVSGIESDRVILSTFALGSALAGIAGILVALDVDMTPTMGMNALLMGVVAVIIGGVGSIPADFLTFQAAGIFRKESEDGRCKSKNSNSKENSKSTWNIP